MQGRLAHQQKDSVYREFTIFLKQIFLLKKMQRMQGSDAGKKRFRKGGVLSKRNILAYFPLYQKEIFRFGLPNQRTLIIYQFNLFGQMKVFV